MTLNRRGAMALMLLVTLMWSMAGVVTRQVEQAQGLELAFWRSGFNALALLVILGVLRRPGPLARSMIQGGAHLWVSGVCWAVMFTAFMWALTLTKVAHVLVTMALGPLFTALLAAWWLGSRLSFPAWAAIGLAGAGIATMQGGWGSLTSATGSELGSEGWGRLIALCVPVAGAVNWVLLKDHRQSVDLLPAVLIGALLSTAASSFGAWPLRATLSDVSWLALLGVFQLAFPCLLAVVAARTLSAPEMALLSLLEVVLGVAWVWWGTAETPTATEVIGATMVIVALLLHEWPVRRVSQGVMPHC